jgi:hypothetical protein
MSLSIPAAMSRREHLQRMRVQIEREATGPSRLAFFPRDMRQTIGDAITGMIAWCIPRTHWYRAAFWLTSVQGPILGNSGLRRYDHLDAWLQRLTQLGKPFCIPVKVVGVDALPPPGSVKNGLLICSAHIPLVRVGLRALIELDRTPTATIADPSALSAGGLKLPVWGLKEQAPGMANGKFALVRARTILKSGGSVSLLTDGSRGGHHSMSAFRLSQRLGSQMVFLFPEAQSDGSILVSFKKPPQTVCTTEESIQINIRWLEEELRRIGVRA